MQLSNHRKTHTSTPAKGQVFGKALHLGINTPANSVRLDIERIESNHTRNFQNNRYLVSHCYQLRP